MAEYRTHLRVYPRVCGGTEFACVTTAAASGLSPRVRGNRSQFALPNVRKRSIPACAGEPIPNGPTPCAGGVYPRVCGGTWPDCKG